MIAHVRKSPLNGSSELVDCYFLSVTFPLPLKLGRYGLATAIDVVYILRLSIHDSLTVVSSMAASCHSDVLKTIGEKVNADKSVLSEWGIPICSEDNMFHVNLPTMS